MSNNTEEETKPEWQPASLDQITHWYTPDGIPVFVANLADSAKHIEANGFNIYYLISYEEVTEKNAANVVKKFMIPRIWKVTNTLIARSVSAVDSSEVALEVLKEQASFTLPKIPLELRQKLDDFFRISYDMYGTEAIAILTYDPEIGGGDGWGTLIPKQTNSSAHCDYDQESILEDKPDHVYIVGTAHSHPMMPAYASSTDHKDQAGFDGLHITYGWSNKTGGITEYHAEIQLAGDNYTIEPNQIFESPANAPISEEIEAWTKKVEKKATTPKVHSGYQATSQGGKHGTTKTSFTSSSRTLHPPVGCPDPHENVIIAYIDKDEKFCPLCNGSLIPKDFEQGSCGICKKVYFFLEGETLRDLIKKRKSEGVYTYDINIDAPNNLTKSIYSWKRLPDNSHSFVELWLHNRDKVKTDSVK